MQSFPVVIVGGGMVGAAAALALAREDIPVALLEAAEPPEWPETATPRLRVSALNRRSRRFLEGLGGWPADKGRLAPFYRLAVYERGDYDRVAFAAEPGNGEPLGHIVENDLLQRALLEAAQQDPRITLMAPVTPEALELDATPPRLRLADGRRLQAGVVVGADGARSFVREAAGIQWRSKDYAQHALVVTVRLATGSPDITWQRFVETGPQALLPLTNGHASLVWYHRPEEIERLKGLDEEALRDAIMAAFPSELGMVEGVVARGSFAIQRGHAARYVLPGAALIGDAAHVIHPFAGQGLNLGMRDAEVLAERLGQAHRRGRELGSLTALSGFETRRRPANLAVITALDAMHHLFASRVPGSGGLRRLGLRAAQRSGPLKRLVRDYACGTV